MVKTLASYPGSFRKEPGYEAISGKSLGTRLVKTLALVEWGGMLYVYTLYDAECILYYVHVQYIKI